MYIDLAFDELFSNKIGKARLSDLSIGSPVWYRAFSNDPAVTCMQVDIPGVKKEDVTLTLSGKVLCLEAKKNGAIKYRSTINLAHEFVNPEAKLEDGVLTLSLHLPESKKSTSVPIK